MTIDDLERMATFASYVPQAVLRRVADSRWPATSPAIERSSAALLLVDINGFTRLTASALRRGSEATEGLWRALNTYLGQMIDVVADHGGDVTKIVGDALIPIWRAVDEDLETATLRAAACGSQLATDLGELEVEDDLRLSLKIGLCAGNLAAMHVGGLAGRWLFLVAGDAVTQMTRLERSMRTGDVVASPEAWVVVKDRLSGQPLDRGHVLLGPTSPLVDRPAPSGHILDRGAEQAVRSYIPPVFESRIDAGHGAWLAEVRRTTVVFVGIRGIGTATGDTLAVLDQVTKIGQGVLTRFDGWLKEITMDDKGTTLVAAFGVPPFSHDDDPARAIEAAHALTAEIGQLGLSAGAGVATGPAVCGPVGNARRRDFAVLGQHVNLAARLVQESEDGVVLTDVETHDAARGRRTFERLAAYVLKGLSAPIDVYRLVPDGRGGRAASLVGRKDELAVADRANAALVSGVGGLHVVEGEPGIGKSTFVAEWARRAEAAGARSLAGEATEIDASTPYHAWRTVLERLIGLEGTADRDLRRARALDALARDPDALRLAPLLDPILSLDLPNDAETEQLIGEVRADNTRDLLIRLLARAAAERPLMILLEDVHWLDSASWSLVLRAVREIPRLLLVLTTRPGGSDEPLDQVAGLDTTVRLGPLSREEALALACERTGATSIAEPVAAIVDSRAEGNPLFIEQLTYAMRDAGTIVVHGGTVRPAEAVHLETSIIPDTIQRVLTTRLDQLPPGEALTLKVASVIGERFRLRTLREIYPVAIDPAELRRHLQTLIRLDLVSLTTPGSEETFEFRHIIAKEVAYNLMLSAQSRGLHRALAEWHEQTYQDDLTPYHAYLAHHWRLAGVPDKAVEHLELAGLQSLRTFANDEAIQFLAEALRVEADAGIGMPPARRATWHLGLGEAYVHQSRYREGRGHLEIGLRLIGQKVPRSHLGQMSLLVRELARQGGRRLGLGRARRLDENGRTELVAGLRAYERLAEASYYGAESILPLFCVVRILNEAEASGIPAEIARGFAGSGALFGLVPAARIARWYLDRAMGRLAEVDDLATHEIVEVSVGFYHIGAGDWDIARERFRSVRRIARRLGDRRRLDDALSNLAELEYLRGAFAAASEVAADLTASAVSRHDRRFEGEGLVAAGYTAWQMGDAGQALHAIEALKPIVDAGADVTPDLRIKALGLATIVALGRGEKTAARTASEEVMRLTDTRPTYFGTYLGVVGPAEVYLALWESGHPVHDVRDRAMAAVERVRRFAGVFPIGRPRAAILEGRSSWLRGRHGAALHSWRRALVLAEALSMDYERGRAHLELGRHLEPGSDDRSTHLSAAIEIFGRLDAGPALAAAMAEADLGEGAS